jgi:hypothetical protein
MEFFMNNFLLILTVCFSLSAYSAEKNSGASPSKRSPNQTNSTLPAIKKVENFKQKMEFIKLNQFIATYYLDQTLMYVTNGIPLFSETSLSIKPKDDTWNVIITDGTDMPCLKKIKAVYENDELTHFKKAGADQCPPRE